ncbi:Ca2-dependent lipid-binding protein CLB1/vesicle protein vp115/Granuphilin A, contains C2 domain [Phaffia rhodozyma]|uniref:Ca2-dependent lipid-binding protein CLB1/vesicle protein vp115/Granuphilin A, contains C2 domain n=1 Tax=Phaffia rhodozyma TaxID=264483 RepID=A0A0F7SPG2_PHARH|nr:Ca2-dependent lipid-binding protein CLB1/vesicle protein vp115/Granuphilin A, contains C2 domain [Phaffia rhodozyma]
MSLPPAENQYPKSQQTEAQIVQIDEARGTPVHTFDPDASTAEKKAAAGKDRAALNTLDGLQPSAVIKGNAVTELAVDDGSNPAPLPTVTAKDLDKATNEKTNGKANAAPSKDQIVGQEGVPGAIPAKPLQAVPDWYKIGWRAVSGIDAQPGSADASLLASWISEQAYGKTYHNAGVIFFAVATSHFFAIFRLGWGWNIILLAVCATYYELSITRVRKTARDDIQRELVKTRLITETESADWINNFLHRFWKIYEPVLSSTIVASVDAVLSNTAIAGIESIKMTTFTLGNKAPRIDSVRTFPKTADDVVIMDWKLSFTPNDMSDITPREQAFQTNPKIVLEIKVGKGFISAPFPVLLEDMSFVGNMRIKLKLMNNFPHVQLVEMSFLEKPMFDYALKPIGGETLGFDIASIPGLSSFIRDQVHANLGPMMYDPNVFTLNLEQLLSGAPLDSAIGVVQLNIHSARGLEGTKLGGGSPDPYVTIAVAGKAPVAKTKPRSSTGNPQWGETKYILVSSLNDSLALNVFDYNEHRKDNDLGVVDFDLSKLKEDSTMEAISMNVLREGRPRGQLRFDANFFPVLQQEKLADGTLDVIPDSRTGICRLTIHQAKELDGSKILMPGGVNPYAKLFIGGSKEAAHKTGVFKNNFSPSWESSTEFLVMDKSSSVVTVAVVDDRDFVKDPTLGRVTVSLQDLLMAKEKQQDWFPLKGAKTGRIRISAEWKPLGMAGSLNGGAAYVPPIGILKILLKKAVDVKNVEATLGGKSDPYVRVLSAGNVLARTEVVDNNLNPVWDSYAYVPVHHLSERCTLEVMDYQNLTKDRSLGSVEVDVREYATQSQDPRTPYVSLGRKSCQKKIQLSKGGYKGDLFYDVEFFSAVSLKGGISFEEKKDDPSPVSLPSSPMSPITPNVSEVKNAVGDTAAEGADVSANEKEETGVVMTRQDLLNTQSGLLVIQVVSGQLEKKGRLEVLVETGYWASFTTPYSRSTTAAWDFVGEAFIKELDLGRICLRLNGDDDDKKEDIFSEISLDTRFFLEQYLDTPGDLTLISTNGSGRKSTVKICAKYAPVDVVLEPRESANNMGLLKVELIDGHGLRGADRSGKSDPYAVFNLNGEKVFKSEVKKKTLSPVWNEKFETSVTSRVGALFEVEIFDWNQLEQAKSLGKGLIDLAVIEPFEALEATIPISTVKHGEQGSIRIRLVFQPAVIARARKNTSTFSTAGRAVQNVGHAPVAIVGGVGKTAFKGVGLVGHGVGSVGGFAGRKIGLVKKKTDNGSEMLVEVPVDDASDIQDGPRRFTSETVEGTSPVTYSTDFASQNGQGREGSLSVTVLSAKDLAEEVKAEVSLSVGGKTQKTRHHKSVSPEWNESFKFSVTPEISRISLSVSEHKAIGKGRVLGVADVDIWKFISPTAPTADRVAVEFQEGQGVIFLRLEFRQFTSNAGASHSFTSMKLANGSVNSLNNPPPVPGSPSSVDASRKSIIGSSPHKHFSFRGKH